MRSEMNMKDAGLFKVGVFPHQGSRKMKYAAYTRDYNPQWTGCCEHLVTASSGPEAKKIAIESHKAGRCPRATVTE